MCTCKVGRNFVAETKWRKRMTTDTFVLCVIGEIDLSRHQTQHTHAITVMDGYNDFFSYLTRSFTLSSYTIF
jgi:hypothetical protein